MSQHSEIAIPLGKQVSYTSEYDPSLLCPIPRTLGREAAGITIDPIDWFGEDIWNNYELSWLNETGKPRVAIAEIRVPACSPNLIESKSMKLYFNSLNMTRFRSSDTLHETLVRDLRGAAGAEVSVTIHEANDFGTISPARPAGILLDDLEIDTFSYLIDPALLTTNGDSTTQTLYTRLFRSCCPVTGQPDWATVIVKYSGQAISQEGLLRYCVSYREHTGFHEACVERIFNDIQNRCTPEKLEVSARFTRRGGIDINPVRSTDPGNWQNIRDPRQ